MPQFCSSALQRKSGVKYSDFGFQPKFYFSDVKMKWLIQNLSAEKPNWEFVTNLGPSTTPPGAMGRACPGCVSPWKPPSVCGRSQGTLQSPFFTSRGKKEAESSPAEFWRALHWALVQNCLAIIPKNSLRKVIHEAKLKVQEINLLQVQGFAGIWMCKTGPKDEILEYKIISSSLSIQVICLLEKPFTHFTHPESSDSSKGRKGFIRKKKDLHGSVGVRGEKCIWPLIQQ